MEPVFTVALRNHLHVDFVIDNLNKLAQKSKLKVSTYGISTYHVLISAQPINVNKSIQTIVQHRHFVTVASPKSENLSARSAVVRLLHTLFHLHPNNTCQPTHISPLIQLYGGTLSVADRHILSIFHLFEAERSVSCAELLCQWANTGAAPASTLNSIGSLDPTTVFRTCAAFPLWRDAQPEDRVEEDTGSVDIYDPLFVLLLLAKFLSEDVEPAALQWVELFRTNAVSLAMCGMMSRKPGMRKLASSVLAGMWTYVKVRVVLVITVIRD